MIDTNYETEMKMKTQITMKSLCSTLFTNICSVQAWKITVIISRMQRLFLNNALVREASNMFTCGRFWETTPNETNEMLNGVVWFFLRIVFVFFRIVFFRIVFFSYIFFKFCMFLICDILYFNFNEWILCYLKVLIKK